MAQLIGLTPRDHAEVKEAVAATKQFRRGGMLDRREAIFAPPFSATFFNDSGGSIPPFAVMAVTSTIMDGTTYITKVQKPSTTFRRWYLLNGPDEIPYNSRLGYGEAQQGQVVRALYNGSAPSLGAGYGPKPGEWDLWPNYPQTAIAGGAVDETDKIMLATWGPIVEAYATANGSISAGSSGAISIHQGTLGSTTAIPSMDPSIFNAGVDVVNGDPLMVGIILGQLAFTKLCT